MNGPWLSVKGAGKYAGDKSDKWIYRRLPFIEHVKDGSILIAPKAIDDYLATKVVRPKKVKEEPLAPPATASLVRSILGPRDRRGGKKKASP